MWVHLVTCLQSIRQHLLECNRRVRRHFPLFPAKSHSHCPFACSYVPSAIFKQWRLASAELFVVMERLGFAKLCPPLVMCGVELQVVHPLRS